MWLYHRVMSPNNADGIANSVDPDQTAVWSGSALFAQAYLSENLGSLGYKYFWSYLFILEPSLADNDILYSSSGTKLFLMYSVILVNFLTFLFRQVVQGVLVDYPCSLMLWERI